MQSDQIKKSQSQQDGNQATGDELDNLFADTNEEFKQVFDEIIQDTERY